jgi:hypothetical protein
MVMEPLPSYQQFLIISFRGYESCTRCLAMLRLEHTYIYQFFIRYFGPLGRMPHFFLAYTLPYTIRKNKEMKLYHSPKDSYARTYKHIHSLLLLLLLLSSYWLILITELAALLSCDSLYNRHNDHTENSAYIVACLSHHC